METRSWAEASMTRDDQDILRELHQMLLDRVYHEDSLLVQRTYNFVTGNAFLAAALALSSYVRSSPALGYLVIGLGILLANFQLLLGFRNERAIRFWRCYLEIVEDRRGVLFDRALYRLYSGQKTRLGNRCITLPEKRRRGTWTILGRGNILVAVWLPVLYMLFWLSALIAVLISSGNWPWIGPAVIVTLLFTGLCYLAAPDPPIIEEIVDAQHGDGGLAVEHPTQETKHERKADSVHRNRRAAGARRPGGGPGAG
jgi:hypothetical protein